VKGEQVMVFVYAILVGVAVTVSAVLKVTSQRLKQLRQAARLFVCLPSPAVAMVSVTVLEHVSVTVAGLVRTATTAPRIGFH